MTRSILTCSPHFVECALNELRRSAEITVLQQLAPGYVLLRTNNSFDNLTAPWRHRTPIYLHHLFPVRTVVPLQTRRDDLTRLREAALPLVAPDVTIQVRAVPEEELPYSEAEIHQAICGSPPVYSRAAPVGRILSILVVRSTGGAHAYLGPSWASQNLSPWPGGQMLAAEPVSNRAGYKLLEALDTFAIHLRRGDHALDLGASPGAWTTLLRRRGLRVTAVAPTPLYPWLKLDSDVTYYPMVAEKYLGECQTTYDLMVNDMWLDARDSARLMVDYASHLRPEGIAIMTLKLRGQNQHRLMDHAFRLLRKTYKIIRVRQLVSNRKEVTLFLRRKP